MTPARPRRRYHAPCPGCGAPPSQRVRKPLEDRTDEGHELIAVVCGACGEELGRFPRPTTATP